MPEEYSRESNDVDMEDMTRGNQTMHFITSTTKAGTVKKECVISHSNSRSHRSSGKEVANSSPSEGGGAIPHLWGSPPSTSKSSLARSL